jgi:hypothetical protein
VGLIGLGLFLCWYLVLLIDAGLAVRRLPQLTAIIPVATATVVVFLASGQFVAECYLTAGAMTALCALARRSGNAAGSPARQARAPA